MTFSEHWMHRSNNLSGCLVASLAVVLPYVATTSGVHRTPDVSSAAVVLVQRWRADGRAAAGGSPRPAAVGAAACRVPIIVVAVVVAAVRSAAIARVRVRAAGRQLACGVLGTASISGFSARRRISPQLRDGRRRRPRHRGPSAEAALRRVPSEAEPRPELPAGPELCAQDHERAADHRPDRGRRRRRPARPVTCAVFTRPPNG